MSVIEVLFHFSTFADAQRQDFTQAQPGVSIVSPISPRVGSV